LKNYIKSTPIKGVTSTNQRWDRTRSRLRQDSALFVRTRIRSHFLISAVAGDCVVIS